MKRVTCPRTTASSAGILARSVRHTSDASGSSRGTIHCAIVLVIVVLITASPCPADPTLPAAAPPQPSTDDRCPVCGMFVAKYLDWLTQVQFDDDQVRYFDGPKDMFKFLFDMKRYMPGKTRQDVSAILVTDYYALNLIRAEDAHFVTGSDVFGPMGFELVPLATKEEALEFRQDHKGTEIYRLDLITAEVISDLD